MNGAKLLSLFARFAILFGAITTGCYGPFVSVAHVDEKSASVLEEEVKLYKPADLVGVAYANLGDVTATSCKNKLWDPKASESDAISQMRFKAFARHANGLIPWGCESYGTELSKNCWSSVSCRATMIHTPEQQSE
jgi:hypothetical protein